MDTDRLCMGCMKEKEDVNVCPFCGYDEEEEISPLILSPRTQLMNGHYLVGRILGKPGGFGITYLGWDIKLETNVAVKEFLPRDLVGRDIDQATIVPHHSDDRELFKYGLERFLQEAQTLAKFAHPNVVRVRTFFEGNRTAYLVMDYYEGISLAQYMKDKGGRIEEKLAIEIIMPILDGLREVHEKGFLHRDIKPQNIYLTEDGIPILLDFGAARFAVGERSQSLSVVLSPGYSPYEQYHKKGKQGAWTDIYSVAATLYHMLTGQPPLDAADRIMEDDLESIKQLAPEVSSQLNDALMQALSIKAKDRPQGIAEFQEMIMKDREQLFEPPSKSSEIEEAVFQFAKKTGTQKAIKLYLEQFPTGIHAAEARDILKSISKKDKKNEKNKPKKPKKPKKKKAEQIEEKTIEIKAEEKPEELKKELEYTGKQEQIIINLEEEKEEEIQVKEKPEKSGDELENTGEQRQIIINLEEELEKSEQQMEEEALTIEYNLTFEYKTRNSGIIASTGALKRQGNEGVLAWENDTYIKDKFPQAYRNNHGFWEMNISGSAFFDLIMVYIPAGEFIMGSDNVDVEKDEAPVHKVFLNGYWIGKYEVTFKQFDFFCKETGLYSNYGVIFDKKRPPDGGWGRGERPVINVSWNNSVVYCKWLSDKTGLLFQLPTEAQWEKAARGTDMRQYSWGDQKPSVDLANFKENNFGTTTLVTQFPRGASPYGVMDMNGNVWEWCKDWYGEDYYKNSPDRNPEGPANGAARVKRGGSWDTGETGIRCTYRNSSNISHRDFNLGFRLASNIEH